MSLTVTELKQTFKALDKDGTGLLTFREVYGLLTKGDPSMTFAQVKLLFEQIDKSRTGRISFVEFVDYVCGFAEGWQEVKEVKDTRVEDKGWIQVSTCQAILLSDRKVIVAIDGSDVSMAALDYLIHRMQQSQSTTVNIVHVYDVSKTYLPPRYRADALRTHADAALASSVPSRRYKLTWLPKDGRMAGDHLADLAKMQRADFVCMGFVGLKQHKDRHIFSSNTYRVLRQTRCSVMVIKDDSVDLMPINRPGVFVVSATLTKASTKAFLDALRLSLPGDKIYVAYCANFLEQEENVYTEELRAKFNGFFEALCDGPSKAFTKFQDRECAFHIVRQQRGESVPQTIVRFATEVEADFIVVGANATRVDRGKEPVGIVSMDICMETNRNFIVSRH